MELITILLSSLLAIVSPVGFLVDQAAADAIRGQLYDAEELQVRVDNAPNFQLLRGKVDKVRIAGRGLYPRPQMRVAVLDIETDSISLDLGDLQQGDITLKDPLQAAVHIVLDEADLNGFLQSSAVTDFIEDQSFEYSNPVQERDASRYVISNPAIDLLEGDRIRLQADLEDQVLDEDLAVVLESGFAVIEGRQLQLITPQVMIGGETAPSQLVEKLTKGFLETFTLNRLESSGLTARVLEFGVDGEKLNLAFFVRVEPSSTLLSD
ncbi:MAG: DUF2993 domain-containing protein [Leptolyngbyaceae cyanobacterium MO_188.B28]|nr:DUF2993 domain-containing protein [Leptolyngbyaceae cyanobacterium MO_188.B28]